MDMRLTYSQLALLLVLLAGACPVSVPSPEQVRFFCKDDADCQGSARCLEGQCVSGSLVQADAGFSDAVIGDQLPRDQSAHENVFADAESPDRSALDGSIPDRGELGDARNSDLQMFDVLPGDVQNQDSSPGLDVAIEMDSGPADQAGQDSGPCASQPSRCQGDQLVLCAENGAFISENFCPLGCDDDSLSCLLCSPGQQVCDDEDLGISICAADGLSQTQRDCPLGCVQDPNGDRCRQLAVSNLDPELLQSPGAFSQILDLLGTENVINVDEGSINGVVWPDFHVQEQDTEAGLPEVAVFRFVAFNLHADARVRTEGARVLALVARDAMLIEGELDLSAPNVTVSGYVDMHKPGPGGFSGGPKGAPGLGPCPGQPGSGESYGSGSGGGGFGGQGGSGGTYNSGDYDPGAGGGPCGPNSLVPIFGGSGGAGGWALGNSPTGSAANTSCAGGGGGGALILASGKDLRIAATGTIRAGGGGGAQCANATGAGGGAGGAVLIEAPTVNIAGHIAANGGGGAEGDCT